MRVILVACLSWATAAAAADQCTFWVGIAQQELRFVRDDASHPYSDTQRTTFRVRLREGLRQPVANGAKIQLLQAGTSIEGSQMETLSGKSGNVSSGQGTASVSRSMPASYVLVNSSGTTIEYVVDLDPDAGTSYPVQTKSSGSVTASNHPFQSIIIGSAPDPQTPRRSAGGVMRGDYDVRESSTRFIKASWNLKSVVAPCDRPPGIPDIPAATADMCPPPATQRALMDTTWRQRQAKAKQLEKDFKDLEESYQKMQDNLEAWRSAIPLCAIEGNAEKTAEAVVSGFGGAQAELTEVLGKMASGDLSYMASGEWSTLPDAISNITALLGAAIGLGDPNSMEEQISDCKALPEDLKNAAKTFVDAYAEVKSAMPRVQTEVNDVHSLDQKYWDLWHQYYQACLDYAECMGTPASDCPAPPEQPAGPMPGQQ